MASAGGARAAPGGGGSGAGRLLVRTATDADVPSLAALYEESVRSVGPQRYSPAQVDAWAAFARDEEGFRAKVLDAVCLVAEEDGDAVGFATLESDGVVGLLYVRGDRGHRGFGSALLRALILLAEQRGVRRLRTVAGEFSRGLFERFGFTLFDTEEREYNGVVFRRYWMERQVPSRQPAG
jgi:putative acetyltransferase